MLDDFDDMEKFLAHHCMSVVEGGDVGLTLEEGDRLKPRACLRYDEGSIGVSVVRQRAENYRGNRSLADGFYMLANQDDVLGEFPDFICIVLSGTLLRDLQGRSYLACLHYDGDRWNIKLLDFEREYDRGDFFACNDE